MAEILNSCAAIHARVMRYAICGPLLVSVEEDFEKHRIVVKLPLDKLLIEPDELESIINAGIPVTTGIDVEELE